MKINFDKNGFKMKAFTDAFNAQTHTKKVRHVLNVPHNGKEVLA